MTNDLKVASNFRNNIGLSLGITESMIKDVVHGFYAKIRADSYIGPIFQEKIGDEWDHHLALMCDFWSGVVLSTGRYKGQPMPKHIVLPNLDKPHFEHWLALFEENAYSVCPKEAADLFISRARKIAESLMLGVAYYSGKESL